MSSSVRLSSRTKVLHLIIALTMICLMTVGYYMEEFEVFALYPIHKSFGTLLLFVASFRVYWRFKQGWPTPLGNVSVIQHAVAKGVHWVLLISTLLFPLSGLAMSIGGGNGLSVFGLEIVAQSIDAITGDKIPVNEMVAGVGRRVHATLLWVVGITLILHIVGAFKHHVIDKDETIKRMFSFKNS
ncbi:cytochrome b [Thalassotalea atypica]|uniref:cytochrome b n=1 Tax=Thalassotalea atypica TaxID=2054316 RepID=UPI002572C805|nr:cytochrome b [Thalassotalea atypica]